MERLFSSLPLPLTSFIGRERETAEIRHLLAATRLLTLTGAGGSGKTRLALHVAGGLEAIGEPPDGVVWVELAPLADAALALPAVAAAFGLREQPQRSLRQTLVEWLRPRAALLILDNCEHLVEACASLAARLLAHCPRLRIIATSREALGIVGETVYLVPTMTVGDDAETGGERDDATLMEAEAVRLFVERAQAAQPGFRLTEKNADVVARICRGLDGLPLAIELAAARVKTLGLADIAARLADGLRLLSGGPRDLPHRQQALSAAMDWSYDLLPPEEQALFRRLAVFAGGFTLDAAEAVGDDTPLTEGASGFDGVFEQLNRLVDKSLVIFSGETSRYRLLEPIRLYARFRLYPDEAEAVHARHLAWCLALARQEDARLRGPGQAEALARLAREHDNLRVALDWARTHDPQVGLALAGALGWFWARSGHLSEGRRRLDALLAATDATDQGGVAQAARAGALYAAGILAAAQGDLSAAAAHLQTSVSLGWSLGDQRLIANNLLTLSAGAVWQGQIELAAGLLEQCLGLFQAVGDTWGAAATLAWQGEVTRATEDYQAARDLFTASLALFRATGDAWGAGWPLIGLAHLALQQGDLVQAAALYGESLPLFEKLADRWSLGAAHNGLGEVARRRGDNRGANEHLTAGLRNNHAVGFGYGVALSLAGLAALAADTGQDDRAARLFAAAETLLSSLGMTMDPARRGAYTEVAQTVRERMGAGAFTAAWSAGSGWLLEQAVTYAQTPPAPTTSKPYLDQPVQPAAPPVSVKPDPAFPLHCVALGTAAVYRQGVSLAPQVWADTRSQELLFFLLDRGPHSLDQVGATLWPELPPHQRQQHARAAVEGVRRALGDREWITEQEEELAFNRGRLFLYDVELFEGAVAEARRLLPGIVDHAINKLDEAARLYRGEYMAGVKGNGWLEPRRDELRQVYLAALTSLGQLLAEERRLAEAADTYRRLIKEDGLNETAHRELMRCLGGLGEGTAAVQHYQQFETLLRERYGTRPTLETRALYEQLKRGEREDA